MNMRLRRREGFTLVEIMIVVAIIGLLVAIAIPNFIRARTTARSNLCFNNLRLLGHGAEQFIIDSNLDDSYDATEAEAANYVKGGLPTCTGGGAYAVGTETVGTDSGPIVTCTGGGHILAGVLTDPVTYHVLTGAVD